MPEASADGTALARVGKNSLILLASQSITWVLATVVVFVVPRYFGAEAMGWFTVAASLWTIAAAFVGLGTSMYLTIEFAKRRGEAGALVGPVVRVRLLTSCVAFAVVLGFAAIAGYRSEVITMAIIVGVATVLASLADVSGSALVGLEQMSAVGRADIGGKLASTVAALALLALTHNLFFVAASGIVLALVRGTLQYRWLARVAAFDFSAGWRDMRGAVRAASPFLVAGIALVLYQQVDTVVMSLLIDDRQMGWYGTADGLFTTLLFAPTILMTALLPALTREHAADAAAARRLLGQSFDALVLVAVPLGLALVVSAWSGIRLLYGPKFDGARPVLAVYGVVLAFTSFSILFGSYAAAVGRQRFWNGVMAAAIAATIPLDLVLVPWTKHRFGNGAIAGALSYVVTESLMVVIGLALLARHLLDARRAGRVARCVLAGLAQFAAGWPLRRMFVLFPAVAGLAAYLAVVIILRVPTPAERAMVTRLAANVLGRARRLLPG